MVDARDLKSLGAQSLYEFDSRPRHQKSLRIWDFPKSFFTWNSPKACYQDGSDFLNIPWAARNRRTSRKGSPSYTPKPKNMFKLKILDRFLIKYYNVVYWHNLISL